MVDGILFSVQSINLFIKRSNKIHILHKYSNRSSAV